MKNINAFPPVIEEFGREYTFTVMIDSQNLHCSTNQVWMAYANIRQFIFEVRNVWRARIDPNPTDVSFPCFVNHQYVLRPIFVVTRDVLNISLPSKTSSGHEIVMVV